MGMFGNSFLNNPATALKLGAIEIPWQSTNVKPGTWAHGGSGWNTLGRIGDAFSLAGGRQPVYGQTIDAREKDEREQQQALELAQLRFRHPQPTALQQNYEYIKSLDPKLAQNYLAAEANPQTLATDPSTGNVRFVPKGGVQEPSVPSVSDEAGYNALPSGSQFRDPQGNIRVKP